jgi:hypothetical protein
MSVTFWIRRFSIVLAGSFAIIGGVHWAKGHSFEDSVRFGLAWGVITAAVFVAGRLYSFRRGRHCAICRDTPEMRVGG